MINEVTSAFGLLGNFLSNVQFFSWQNIVLLCIGLFWLIFASIEDFKRREVENWWTFSLIIFVLIFRLFFSIENKDYMFFLLGLYGLLAGFIVAEIFYYSRMFAGGDAKLLMALGTILFFSTSLMINLLVLFIYLLLFIICGSIYGLIYSFILTLKYLPDFKKSFGKLFKEFKRLIMIVDFFTFVLVVIFIYFNFQLGIFLSVLIFVSPYLLIYGKAIEESCMKSLVAVSDLTIGDWLAKPLRAGNKTIKPYWEGLGEKELALIQKNYRGKVLVKQGIPFVPAFLLALLVFILLLAFI